MLISFFLIFISFFEIFIQFVLTTFTAPPSCQIYNPFHIHPTLCSLFSKPYQVQLVLPVYCRMCGLRLEESTHQGLHINNILSFSQQLSVINNCLTWRYFMPTPALRAWDFLTWTCQVLCNSLTVNSSTRAIYPGWFPRTLFPCCRLTACGFYILSSYVFRNMSEPWKERMW